MSLIKRIFHPFLHKLPIWQDSCITATNFKKLITQNSKHNSFIIFI